MWNKLHYWQERSFGQNKPLGSFIVFLQKQVYHNITQYTDYTIHRFLRFHLGAKQTFGKKKKAIPCFNDTILKQPALTGHTNRSTFNETMYDKGHYFGRVRLPLFWNRNKQNKNFVQSYWPQLLPSSNKNTTKLYLLPKSFLSTRYLIVLWIKREFWSFILISRNRWNRVNRTHP